MYRVCRDEKASSDAEKSIYTCPILLSLLLFSHMHARTHAHTHTYIRTHTYIFSLSLSLSLFVSKYTRGIVVRHDDVTDEMEHLIVWPTTSSSLHEIRILLNDVFYLLCWSGRKSRMFRKNLRSSLRSMGDSECLRKTGRGSIEKEMICMR